MSNPERPAKKIERWKFIINDDHLRNTEGLWGDAHGCHGNAMGLVGSVTHIRGELGNITGLVHDGLRGDVSQLIGDISGLTGEIVVLKNRYIFKGIGGDLSILYAVDDYLYMPMEIDRPVHEWGVIYLALALLDPLTEGYKPDLFIEIIKYYKLEQTLISVADELEDENCERLSLPEEIVTYLTGQ